MKKIMDCNKTYFKRASAVLSLVLCAAFMLGACSSQNKSNTLRVGMECDYAPFNWTQTDSGNGAANIDGGGYAGGFDVEIAKLLAAGLNKELVIVKTGWDGLLPAVTSNKIDLIIAGMSPTADRKESIDFSENYYISDLVLVVMKNGPYANAKGLSDFAGAKITGQQGTFHYSVIDQIPGVDQQTALEDFPTMIVALTSGKIDGYVSERPGAISAAATNPEITYIAPEPGFQYEPDDAAIAVGLKKGSPLLSDINKIISGIS
jgi:putative lysine transport system substrate-binding protein